MSFLERELLAGGKLSFARVARETREMVHAASRASHPIVGVDTSSASSTFRAELSAVEIITKINVIPYKAACSYKKKERKGWDKVMLWCVKHVVSAPLHSKEDLLFWR